MQTVAFNLIYHAYRSRELKMKEEDLNQFSAEKKRYVPQNQDVLCILKLSSH